MTDYQIVVIQLDSLSTNGHVQPLKAYPSSKTDIYYSNTMLIKSEVS